MRVPMRLIPAILFLAACGGAPGRPGDSPAAMRAPSAEQLASIARGDSLFNTGGCARCHGQNGAGAQNGPSLVTGAWLHVDGSQAQIAALIITGVPREAITDSTRRFPMRARGGPMNVTDAQAQDIAAYVVSISRAKTAR